MQNLTLTITFYKVCDAGPGYWLEWGAYSACDSTCIGTKVRTRLQSCSGDQQIEADTCGVDPGFGEFSEWSECTVTCGGGTRSRERSNVCSGVVDIEAEFVIVKVLYNILKLTLEHSF